MNIFDKRPLFLIISALISGFVIFTFSDGLLRGLLIFLAILLIGLSLFLFFKKKIRNALIVVIPIVLLFSIIFSLLYFDVYFDLYDQYDSEVKVEGTIISIEKFSYTSNVLVKTSKINGKTKNGYKILLYLKNNQLWEDVSEGNIISFDAVLGEFEDFSDIDANIYYFSRGVSARAYEVSNLQYIDQGNLPIFSKLQIARNNIREKVLYLSDERSANLFSALFLGERDFLGDQIKLDFKILGITHILALSGFHLSIISAGMLKTLSLLKVKKKARIVITGALIILYMIFTGLSISVVRAGIMILVYSALFLLGKTKDSLTSLGIAVLTIIMVTPYAIYDLSLWLSAFATLGIVVMSELNEYSKSTTILEKTKKAVKGSISASFFATSATLLITVMSFGTISIASAISTLIFSFLAEIIIYLGMIILIVGDLINLGPIISFVTDKVYKLASIMSDETWIYFSTNSVFIKILIIIYTVIFALFIISNFKSKRKAAKILAFCFIIVLLLSTVSNIFYTNSSLALYDSATDGDRIILREDSEVSLIAINTYSSSSAYSSVELLEDYRITYVDNYYVTHYSDGLTTNILKLVSLVKTKYVYVPAPQNETESYMLYDLIYNLDNHSSNLVVYENSTTISGYVITNMYHTKIDDNERKAALCISNNNLNCLYLSSGMLKGAEDRLLVFENALNANTIIFGNYGTKYSSTEQFDMYVDGVTKIVITCKKIKLEYHTEERYNKNGTEILNPSTAINIFY